MTRKNLSVKELGRLALVMRRNVIDICMQRGGYAGQGVALADLAACLYFHEMRPDGKGWFHDRFVNSNGHDAIMTYAALAEHGSYTMVISKPNWPSQGLMSTLVPSALYVRSSSMV